MIVFNDLDHAFRIATAAGVQFNSAVDTCIAHVDERGLRGGNIYNGFTGASMNVHMAGFDPHWASIDMLWVGFHYPFIQCGCKKLFAQVPSWNSRALEIDKKLGFKEEARIKDVFPEGDLVVLAMKREDCKWLKLKPRSLKEPV